MQPVFACFLTGQDQVCPIDMGVAVWIVSKLLSHNHQVALTHVPLCSCQINVKISGSLERFSSLGISTGTKRRLFDCSIRKLKVQVEYVEAWDNQRDPAGLKIEDG